MLRGGTKMFINVYTVDANEERTQLLEPYREVAFRRLGIPSV
jgi:hypothetical protein